MSENDFIREMELRVMEVEENYKKSTNELVQMYLDDPDTSEVFKKELESDKYFERARAVYILEMAKIMRLAKDAVYYLSLLDAEGRIKY